MPPAAAKNQLPNPDGGRRRRRERMGLDPYVGGGAPDRFRWSLTDRGSSRASPPMRSTTRQEARVAAAVGATGSARDRRGKQQRGRGGSKERRMLCSRGEEKGKGTAAGARKWWGTGTGTESAHHVAGARASWRRPIPARPLRPDLFLPPPPSFLPFPAMGLQLEASILLVLFPPQVFRRRLSINHGKREEEGREEAREGFFFQPAR